MLINEIAIRCNAPLAPEAVRALMAHTDWARQRNVPDIATMLRHTTLHVSAWHNEQLVGFARVLTDGVYRAVIEDVIVAPAYRGQGLGHKLLAALLAELAGMEEIALGCMENLVPFYESFGFQRVTHPLMKKR